VRHPRIGLNLPYSEGQLGGETPRWTDIRGLAQLAEDMGFDSIWMSDHIGFGDPAGSSPGAWRGAWDSWTMLAALAEATSRVQLGNYVLCTPFRNPALLAKMAETLDEVSGGRLILGLGAGWNEIEFSTYGFPFADRFDRFEDDLRIITSMVRTGRATHDGRVEHAHDARIEPRGPRPNGLPVMVGAARPRLIRLTAELADHWNGSLHSVDETRELLAAVDAACRTVGRDPATLTRSVEILVRTLPAGPGEAPRDHELRGVAAITSTIGTYADLRIDELQVQFVPNTRASVEAFGPILDALAAV
jgi:alkanesulfonate monooxygenase SsuD/methylene tetrahydromethanopterin reductase-like flavin-dependent oxidoreductase (luciferase family)